MGIIHVYNVSANGGLYITASWFIVHVRAPGVVALQNKMQPDLYLRAEPDQLTTAPGGSRCNFIVKDNGEYSIDKAS